MKTKSRLEADLESLKVCLKARTEFNPDLWRDVVKAWVL